MDVYNLVVEEFVAAEVHFFGENVSSTAGDCQQALSAAFELEPTHVCPSPFSWINRPRFFWCDWCLRDGGLEVATTASVATRGAERRLKGVAKRGDCADWLDARSPWSGGGAGRTLPTLPRSEWKKTEMSQARGIEKCSEAELAVWDAAGWPCAPYHLRQCNLVSRANGGPRRLLSCEEYERLFSFEVGYTVLVFSSSQAKTAKEDFTFARKALLHVRTLTLSCFAVASVFGCLAHRLGYLTSCPTRAQVRFGLVLEIVAVRGEAEVARDSTQHVRKYSAEGQPLCWLMSQAGSRVSDVRLTTGALVSSRKLRHMNIDVGWRPWQELFGYPWT